MMATPQSPYIVSALKYRPQEFSEVVGQEAITQTLEKAIEQNKLAQALLFCGPRGVGKTTCARILAKKINEEKQEGKNQDFAFNIFELDAASNNTVDDIRSLNEQVRIPPQVGTHKVYIIDEVHMLSLAAFNAFLKTLEEPPAHVIFILATTEKHKIIPTILSRCQIYDFKRMSVADIKSHLQNIASDKGIAVEDEALYLIAQKADGAMRDALSLFDRMVAHSQERLTTHFVAENLNIVSTDTYFELTDLLTQQNIPELLIQLDNILSRGFEGTQFLEGLATHFRELLVCKDPKTLPLLTVSKQTAQRFQEQSEPLSLPYLLHQLEIIQEHQAKYKSVRNKRLHLELCTMQLASSALTGEKKKPT
ncbi:MAG: DNA polymerase III subunit gamma/tau [Flavobacteriaceae bacterium]